MTGTFNDIDRIAADWGTSSLRVWAMGADGSVLGRADSAAGMGRLTAEGYKPALVELVGPRLAGKEGRTVPAIVCGMAGARQGWREAAYRSVPCAPVPSGGLTNVPTEDRRLAVAIVPGLSQADPADVTRGEETQIAGLVERGITVATICQRPCAPSVQADVGADQGAASFAGLRSGHSGAEMG